MDGIVSFHVIVRKVTVILTLDTVPWAVKRIATDQDVSFCQCTDTPSLHTVTLETLTEQNPANNACHGTARSLSSFMG